MIRAVEGFPTTMLLYLWPGFYLVTQTGLIFKKCHTCTVLVATRESSKGQPIYIYLSLLVTTRLVRSEQPSCRLLNSLVRTICNFSINKDLRFPIILLKAWEVPCNTGSYRVSQNWIFFYSTQKVVEAWRWGQAIACFPFPRQQLMNLLWNSSSGCPWHALQVLLSYPVRTYMTLPPNSLSFQGYAVLLPDPRSGWRQEIEPCLVYDDRMFHKYFLLPEITQNTPLAFTLDWVKAN